MSTSPVAASAMPRPFVLEPICVERIWGVHDLAPWRAETPGVEPIGEIWLTAEECQVGSGPAQGLTLAEVTKNTPEALGDPKQQGFPLLIKLLFPREKLSVQVHPDDSQAQALGMPRGKTECWYILSAEPGAEVAVGFREALTPADVRQAIEDGTMESKLQMIPVKAGDMVFVDAGTVHAIGPGMVVLETQQYSDTTYRLWDYGRPRELHIDAGTAVTRTATAAGLVGPQVMDGFTRLVTSAYFTVDRFNLRAGDSSPLSSQSGLQILIALEEGCTLQTPGDAAIQLPRGKAVVLPLGSGDASLHAASAVEVVRVLQP